MAERNVTVVYGSGTGRAMRRPECTYSITNGPVVSGVNPQVPTGRMSPG
jgi:hypothetical protein